MDDGVGIGAEDSYFSSSSSSSFSSCALPWGEISVRWWHESDSEGIYLFAEYFWILLEFCSFLCLLLLGDRKTDCEKEICGMEIEK